MIRPRICCLHSRSDGSTEHLNQIAGHLVRTKPGGVDEGGVAAGYAYLDSPILVDQ
jgi:hypothetical protein